MTGSKELHMEYLERSVTVSYHIEENRMHIERVEFEGRDVTDRVCHDKVYHEMPEEIYNKTVTDEENKVQL